MSQVQEAVPATFRTIVLRQRPGREVVVQDVFGVQEASIKDPPAEGQFVIKLLYFGHDPTQRNWISTPASADPARQYVPPVVPGEVMRGSGVGEVVASANAAFPPGCRVYGYFGWREYLLVDPASPPIAGLMALPPDADPARVIASTTTAMTAYFGLLNVAQASGKESTIVVSTAAGATGSVVCQIAKNVLGIKNVIGIAGTDEKCAFIKAQCGVDVALNYKSPTFAEEFAKATPSPGFIDIYWDNVGGRMLNMALERMVKFGKIIACGAISQYGAAPDGTGITWRGCSEIIRQSLTVRGFILLDFASEIPKAFADIHRWIKEGKVTPHYTVVEHRFEQVPEGMSMLLKGSNTGKLVSKIVQ